MASLSRACSRLLALKNSSKNFKPLRVAYISTSKNDKDTISATPSTPNVFDGVDVEKFKLDAKETCKNWTPYGFDLQDRETDVTFVHLFFFAFVTFTMVAGGYFQFYAPNRKMQDWAQREAYLEIRRREEAGLPHIDPNLIPPENIELPSDEELGDMNIII